MGKARTRREQMKQKLDADLDRARANTFPASDPVAVGHATATEPPGPSTASRRRSTET
jgi:hypothetical protein